MRQEQAAASTAIVGWELIERRYDAHEEAELVRLRVDTAAADAAHGDGIVNGVYHPPLRASGAGIGAPGVVWVGGVGGGLSGPANGMYPRLARQLAAEGAHSLRLDYRHPLELESCVVDCLIGTSLLREEGAGQLGLVGHSSGGAVVITTGALVDDVATVVALATQSYGTQFAAELEPASLLLVHGLRDSVLPASCSIDVEQRASTRTALRLIEGAGHSFERAEEEVSQLVLDWLRQELLAGRRR